MTFALEIYARLDNTMRQAARRALDGADHGTTVMTTHQETGRGRRGNTWECPPGASLCMTTLLRGPATAMLSVRVAVAAVEALPVTAQIKWPNDLWIGGRKVAGILIQVQGPLTLVGIGVNLLRSAAPGISLEEAGARPEPRELARALADGIEAWSSAGAAGVVAAWCRHDALRDVRVTGEAASGAVEGIARGISANGALRVDTATGTLELHAGEVHRVREIARSGIPRQVPGSN